MGDQSRDLRRVRRQISGIAVEYELFGRAPVQAVGTVGDREFYFRARHSEWDLEVAELDGRLASDLDRKPVFFRSGRHANASFMEMDEAEALIAECLREYLNARTE